MSEEQKEENPFEGFNLIKDNALAVPEKVVKGKTKEETTSTEETKTEDTSEDVFESAKKEVDEFASKKSKKEDSKVVEKQEEEAEEEQEYEQESEEESEEGSLKPFVSHLASKGLIDWEEGDEFDDSEEGLEQLQQKTISNGINKWRSGYDEDTQKYLEFVENGGRPSDFHKYYYGDSSFANLKIEGDEDVQKHVIREGLIAAGWEDEDEINDEISLYEDAGKLEVKAESHLKRLQKLEGEQKNLLIAAQKKYAQEQQEIKKQEWESFKKGLFDTDQISGFKFSPKMKEEVWDYMTRVVDKKSGATKYQLDSQEKGPEARYIFAYLMKNNWDASKLEKDLKNKVISGVKKKLSNYSDSRSKMKSGTPREAREESNSFSGFRKIAV